ncbi:MAG: hypothetical protein JJU46_00315 [Balneolaceae bacterium]|nr:hypothetical protein [Balneolaceae bacterium]
MNKKVAFIGRSHLKSILIVMVSALGLVIYSCSDSPTSGIDENGDTDPSGDSEPIDENHQFCEDLILSVDSAQPLDIIEVEGFVDEFGDEPIGWIFSEENEGSQVPIYVNANYNTETAEFIMPLHPIHWLEGGEAEIVLSNSDGSKTCGGFQMMIESLDPAPGETQRFLDEYNQYVKGLIESMGFDADKVAGESVQSLPAELAPLAAALQGFDSDYVENNLKAILSGDAPILDGETLSDEVVAAIDALFGKAGLADLLGQTETTKMKPVSGAIGNLSCHRNEDSTNYTPACLDYLVKLQSQFQQSTDGVSGAFYEFSEVALGAASLSLGVLALGTAGATAPAAAAAGVAGNAMAIQNLVNDVMSNVLPSQFVDFELLAAPLAFNEDSEEIGEWVSFVKFTSRGTTITNAQIAGLLPAGRLIDNNLVQGMISELSQEVAKLTYSFGASILGSVAEQGITYEPKQYLSYINPKRDGDEDYYRWELHHLESWNGSQAFEFYVDFDTGEIDEQKYIPLVEGKTELRVRTNDGVFNFSPGLVLTEELILKPIEIELDPDEVVLYLKDFKNEDLKVDFFAEVENADDEELEWVSEDNGDGFFMQNDDKGHHVTYFPHEKAGTYLVVAESITETGPRQGKMPPRTESVRVRVIDEDDSQGMLFMQPNSGCVALDDEFTFQPFIGDPFSEEIGAIEIPFEEIDWDMEGAGSLSSSGTFTPDEEGFVEIVFIYDDEASGETHTASASFVVLESCGELTVSSDYFEYTTSCVSADSPEAPTPFPYDLSAVMAAGWTDLGGADLTVTMEANIEEETGSWTRSFKRMWGGFDGSGSHWSIPNFLDHTADEWQPIEVWELENPEDETFDVERVEITVGDSSIGLLSGEFNMTMYNYSEYERENQYSDERTISEFRGEFHGIPIIGGINICQ